MWFNKLLLYDFVEGNQGFVTVRQTILPVNGIALHDINIIKHVQDSRKNELVKIYIPCQSTHIQIHCLICGLTQHYWALCEVLMTWLCYADFHFNGN